MSRALLPDLHAFATVARLRSFRRAAQSLSVSPSALSHAMRGLEERLGVRLLHRTTRSVAPTEAGERLLGRLGVALDDIEQALEEVNAFRTTPMGTLRINAPRAAAAMVLPPIVARFLAANPGMRVETIGENRMVDIVAEGFDAGVRFGESLQQDMVAVPLGPPQRFVVVAAPDYLARRGRPQCPRELHQHSCIRIRRPGGATYHWEFIRGNERLEIDADGPLTTDEMAGMVTAAEAGIGLAYVYAGYAEEGLRSGRLVTVLDDWCPPIPGFFLYYPSRRLAPAGLQAFVDMLRADAAALPR